MVDCKVERACERMYMAGKRSAGLRRLMQQLGSSLRVVGTEQGYMGLGAAGLSCAGGESSRGVADVRSHFPLSRSFPAVHYDSFSFSSLIHREFRRNHYPPLHFSLSSPCNHPIIIVSGLHSSLVSSRRC